MINGEEIAQRRLTEFKADSGDPRWSSFALESLFKELPGKNSVEVVFRSLSSILYSGPLTSELAAFIKDVVVTAFTKFRGSFDAANLEWIETKLIDDCPPAIAYFVAYSTPGGTLSTGQVVLISRALAGTSFWPEVAAHLTDDLQTLAVKESLAEWYEGLDQQAREAPDARNILDYLRGE